jgi:hypothetical protein
MKNRTPAVFPLSSIYVKVYSDYVTDPGTPKLQGLLPPIKSAELQAEIGQDIYSHSKIFWLGLI